MYPSRNIYLATLWLMLIKGVWCSRLPRVWWLPGTDAVEGDTIQLQCQVASKSAAIWFKLDPRDSNKHTLLSHGGIIITEDPRFSVKHHSHDNVYILKIQEVSPEDAGSYQCQVQVSREDEDLKVEAAPPVVVTLHEQGHSSAPSHPLFSLPLLLLLLLTFLLPALPR